MSGDMPRCDVASLLRIAAEGRDEYAVNAPAEQAEVLRIEASTLRHAANVADGDLRVMRSWLPSWRWHQIPEDAAPAAPEEFEWATQAGVLIFPHPNEKRAREAADEYGRLVRRRKPGEWQEVTDDE